MPDAFVNVVVEGDVPSAVSAIDTIDGVEQAHEVRGAYDIVVALELNSPEELQRTVTGRIQSVPGVEETVTTVSPELAEHHRPDEDRVR